MQIQQAAPSPAGQKRIRRFRTIAGTIVFMLASAVAAFAFWSTIGNGGGNTKTSSNVNSTVVASVAPSVDSGLWPGNTDATDLHFTVNNPNPYDVTFTSATVGAVTGLGGCAASEFETTAGTINLSAPLSVAAGDTAVTGFVPDAIKLLNLAENQDDCQGATISAVVTLTGTQDQ